MYTIVGLGLQRQRSQELSHACLGIVDIVRVLRQDDIVYIFRSCIESSGTGIEGEGRSALVGDLSGASLMPPVHQVEPTKQNLRLMILEDVLYFHPECKGHIEPSRDATTAMMALSSIPAGSLTGVSGSSSGHMSSLKEAAAAGSPIPPPAAKPSASAATTEELERVVAEEGKERRHQAMQKAEATRVPIAANDDGSQKERAWPPEETARLTSGAEARPGWAGDSDDGGVEEAVVLTSVAVARSGDRGKGGTATPGFSRREGSGSVGGDAGGGGGVGGGEGEIGTGNAVPADDVHGDGSATVQGGVEEDEKAQEQEVGEHQTKAGNEKVSVVDETYHAKTDSRASNISRRAWRCGSPTR